MPHSERGCTHLHSVCATSCNLISNHVLHLLLAPALLFAQASAPPCRALCLSRHALDALAAGRYPDYLNYAQKVAERAPDHPGVIYAVARGYALVGKPAAALRWLRRLADLGVTRDVDSDSAFAGLRASPTFRAVRARLQGNRAPMVRGALAFALPDSDLLPEALAHDPITKGWLVGSLAKRKIIRLAQDRTASDFISNDELLRVVGIHVDSARALLWFATWAPRAAASTPPNEIVSQTRLFKCDLRTGHIMRRYVPPDSGRGHLFNDLAIAANGDVFITDTDQGSVYRVPLDADTLELFLSPDPERFSDANGITLSGDDLPSMLRSSKVSRALTSRLGRSSVCPCAQWEAPPPSTAFTGIAGASSEFSTYLASSRSRATILPLTVVRSVTSTSSSVRTVYSVFRPRAL